MDRTQVYGIIVESVRQSVRAKFKGNYSILTMRILLKCPTRGRREKFLLTIKKWIDLADNPELMGILVSADVDDPSMRGFTEADLPNVPWKKVCFGESKTKIQACNADIEKVDWEWDIVILVSDDMIPKVKGYDSRVRGAMKDLNHIVWIYDGFQNAHLNTLNIFGRERYLSWGYLYHPEYKSLYCDNEITDWCRANSQHCTIITDVIIKHEHPYTTPGIPTDELYKKNQIYVSEDHATYKRRKLHSETSKLGFLKLLSRR